MFRAGQYLERPKFPARIGYEASGTVDAIGEGVEELQVGDAVSTIPGFAQNDYGVYGEGRAGLRRVRSRKHPASLSWEEAAAIWMQYATAYGALVDIAKLKKRDTVLIPAASSSVGLAAIQITNLAGATPIALTRTGEKRQALLDAGAAHVIATEEQDLVVEVMKLTRKKGARGCIRPCGRSDTGKAGSRDQGAGHHFPIRRTQQRADVAALDESAGQITDRARLPAFRDHGESQAPEKSQAVHRRRAGFGKLKPVIGKNLFRSRLDRRSPPLPGE
jgi:NADPH:quinone reductase-like Zn-dependent oxidoreductase